MNRIHNGSMYNQKNLCTMRINTQLIHNKYKINMQMRAINNYVHWPIIFFLIGFQQDDLFIA
jgi:hypothetical protein